MRRHLISDYFIGDYKRDSWNLYHGAELVVKFRPAPMVLNPTNLSNTQIISLLSNKLVAKALATADELDAIYDYRTNISVQDGESYRRIVYATLQLEETAREIEDFRLDLAAYGMMNGVNARVMAAAKKILSYRYRYFKLFKAMKKRVSKSPLTDMYKLLSVIKKFREEVKSCQEHSAIRGCR